jgi:hypothetical protein
VFTDGTEEQYECQELPGLQPPLLVITLPAGKQVCIVLASVKLWTIQLGSIQITDKMPKVSGASVRQ